MKITTIVGGLFLGFIGLGLAIAAFEKSPDASPRPATIAAAPSDPKPEPAHEAIDVQDIYFRATGEIREKLKSPTSAKFSELGRDPEAKMTQYGYRQYLCSGFVDSQNSFGAMIRETWGAYVFESPQAVRVDYLEIGDAKYGQLPPRIPLPKN